jgi:hypothetical protein
LVVVVKGVIGLYFLPALVLIIDALEKSVSFSQAIYHVSFRLVCNATWPNIIIECSTWALVGQWQKEYLT